MHEGFKAFIASLLPTKHAKAVKRSTLNAVCRACEQIRLESPNTGMRWQVASVIKAGSFEKATGLRGK
jgi:ribosomal protein L44E